MNNREQKPKLLKRLKTPRIICQFIYGTQITKRPLPFGNGHKLISDNYPA